MKQQVEAPATKLELATLSNKLMAVCAFTLLTYDLDERLANSATHPKLMCDSADVSDWLTSMETMRKLRADHRTSTPPSDDYFMNIVFDQVDLCLIRNETVYTRLVSQCDYTCLTHFVRAIWPDMDSNRGQLGRWTLCTERQSPVWHMAYFSKLDKKGWSLSTEGAATVHVSMSGEVLINGSPVSRLPDTILEHPVYARFFGKANFDVLPSAIGLGAYCFKDKSDTSSFTLYRNDNDDLVVIEKRGKSVSYLLPQSLFVDKFPAHLVESYSYWLKPSGKLN